MSYFSFLLYILSHKKMLLLPFLVAGICFGIAWILPPYYKSEIRIQIDASQSDGAMSMLSSVMAGKGKGLSGFGGSLSSLMASSADLTARELYMEVITGRDVMLETIQEFRLDTLYKKKSKDLLLKRFNKEIRIDDEDGVISCSFEAKDKYMAQDLVRFMVNRANEKYQDLQKQGLRYSVEYLQKSQRDLMDSVKSISEELVKFYRRNNLVDLESQMKLTMTALAAYEGQINNFKLSEKSEGERNASAAEMRKRRTILEQQFKELRGSYSKGYKPSEKTLYVNSNWAMSKILYQKQRQAELEMYLSILEMTSAQAMMTEAERLKSQPAIQIIQDAYVADWKTRPKRGIWAVAGFGASLFMVFVYLLLAGLLSGEIENHIELKEKLEQVKIALRK